MLVSNPPSLLTLRLPLRLIGGVPFLLTARLYDLYDLLDQRLFESVDLERLVLHTSLYALTDYLIGTHLKLLVSNGFLFFLLCSFRLLLRRPGKHWWFFFHVSRLLSR